MDVEQERKVRELLAKWRRRMVTASDLIAMNTYEECAHELEAALTQKESD